MTFIPEKYSGNRPAFRGQYGDPPADPHWPCPSDRGRPGAVAAILPRRARVPSHHEIRLGRRLPLGPGPPPSPRAQTLGGAPPAPPAPGPDPGGPLPGFLSGPQDAPG